MIFVVEHEKDGIWQCETVYGVEDLDTTQYQPIKKIDRKSTRLNSSHSQQSRMPSSA